MDDKDIEELKELAWTQKWVTDNRWGMEEYKDEMLNIIRRVISILTNNPDILPKPPADNDLELPNKDYEPPTMLIPGNDFPIVGRSFTKQEFIDYVSWLRANKADEWKWNPTGITVHHTAYPDLSMRPNGWSEENMKSLRHFYRNTRGWGSGPHLFTDDTDDCIWVLTPLTHRGVHASSFNSSRYGIEMLGNFDNSSDYSSERGQKSIENGQWATAILMKYADIGTDRMNFHRHDPRTSKSCPGKLINFDKFEEQVLAKYEQL